jgi:transporter family-2 protein
MNKMQLIIFMLLVLVAGMMLPVQVGLNHKLGKALESAEFATLVSFIVGSIGMFLYMLVTKQNFNNFTNAFSIDWYAWLGGLLGAFYVAVTIMMAPKLGIALTFGLIVTGQMIMSLALDHFGLLGIQVHHINLQKVFGALLLIAGVVVIRNS